MTSDFLIEPEGPDDAPAVREIVALAFHAEPVVPDLVEAIRSSPEYVPGLALVARLGGEVVGFVMLSRAEVVQDGARHDVLTLSPLAVHPDHRRQGIGSALVRAGVSAADSTGAPMVTLEGSPDYYGRLGFRFAPDLGVRIDLPDWAPPEAAQIYPLSAYDPAVRGLVVYPPAFDVL